MTVVHQCLSARAAALKEALPLDGLRLAVSPYVWASLVRWDEENVIRALSMTGQLCTPLQLISDAERAAGRVDKLFGMCIERSESMPYNEMRVMCQVGDDLRNLRVVHE